MPQVSAAGGESIGKLCKARVAAGGRYRSRRGRALWRSPQGGLSALPSRSSDRRSHRFWRRRSGRRTGTLLAGGGQGPSPQMTLCTVAGRLKHLVVTSPVLPAAGAPHAACRLPRRPIGSTWASGAGEACRCECQCRPGGRMYLPGSWERIHTVANVLSAVQGLNLSLLGETGAVGWASRLR